MLLYSSTEIISDFYQVFPPGAPCAVSLQDLSCGQADKQQLLLDSVQGLQPQQRLRFAPLGGPRDGYTSAFVTCRDVGACACTSTRTCDCATSSGRAACSRGTGTGSVGNNKSKQNAAPLVVPLRMGEVRMIICSYVVGYFNILS